MKKFQLRKMSGAGDEMVAEWTETTSKERLDEIEKEFNEMMKAGYTPANLDTNELVREFDPNANMLMLPRVAGG